MAPGHGGGWISSPRHALPCAALPAAHVARRVGGHPRHPPTPAASASLLLRLRPPAAATHRSTSNVRVATDCELSRSSAQSTVIRRCPLHARDRCIRQLKPGHEYVSVSSFASKSGPFRLARYRAYLTDLLLTSMSRRPVSPRRYPRLP